MQFRISHGWDLDLRCPAALPSTYHDEWEPLPISPSQSVHNSLEAEAVSFRTSPIFCFMLHCSALPSFGSHVRVCEISGPSFKGRAFFHAFRIQQVRWNGVQPRSCPRKYSLGMSLRVRFHLVPAAKLRHLNTYAYCPYDPGR